jgi:hypothetical protein
MAYEDILLDINTETFKALKDDINFMLKNVLQNMQERDLAECDMNIKLHVGFEKSTSGDSTSTVPVFINPVIKHDIQAVFKQTAKKGGSLAPANTMLVFDAERQAFVLRHIDDGQQDIFDGPESANEPETLPALTAPDESQYDAEAEAEAADEVGTPEAERPEGYVPHCIDCEHSNAHGFPQKRGACLSCDQETLNNFKGRCSNCKYRSEHPFGGGDCPDCGPNHAKWEME